MTCVSEGCLWSLAPTGTLWNVPRVVVERCCVLWQKPKSTGTDGGFEKGAAVGCGGLSPYSLRYLSAPALMRVAACWLCLNSAVWQVGRDNCGCAVGSDDWLAGSQSQQSHGPNSVWAGNLARGRDRVPGKSRNRDVELVGYHAQERQWLGRGLEAGSALSGCLAASCVAVRIDEGGARDQRGHDTGWGEGVVSGSQGRRSKLPVTSLWEGACRGSPWPAGASHWPVQRPCGDSAGVLAGAGVLGGCDR